MALQVTCPLCGESIGGADEDVARDAEKALVRLGSPLVPLAPGAASHAAAVPATAHAFSGSATPRFLRSFA